MKTSTKERLKDKMKVAGACVCVALLSPIICIYAVWHISTGQPSFSMCGNARMQATRRKKTKEAFQNEAPAPLPPRKRALTSPLPPSPAGFGRLKGIQQIAADQAQSILFNRLPPELREMVYEFALSDFAHIHLFRRQDYRLGHYKCHSVHRPKSQLLQPGIYNAGELKGCKYPAVTCTNAWIPGRWQDSEITELLPLLKTCRRVYSEAINVLYARNLFCFPDIRTISTFTKTTLSHRLSLIKAIEMEPSVTIRVGDTVSNSETEAVIELTDLLNAFMPGVQELRVGTSCLHCREDEDQERLVHQWWDVVRQRFETRTKAKMVFIKSDIVCVSCHELAGYR
ncbi:MAG: hypothetical protein Q9221_001497 [Calogaya cf. arnoldii]